jgi:hypothetical protein
MNPPVRLLSLCCWLAVSIGIQRADAQWLTQTLNLKAGWNAVFLHVDASHAPIDALLAADPNASIEEIWLWNPDPSTQQFVQSPQEPTGGGPQWMTWTRSLGDSSPLQKLVPNAACLVRVRNEIPAYAWQLKGKPVVPRYQWTTSGLNFLGFPTAPVSPPSFEDFLAQAPSEFQRNAEVYRYPGGDLGPGNPMRVFALRATPVTRGEAYWIRSGEIYNRYYGPFEVVSAGAGAVAFGSTLRAISLRLRNLSPSDLTVTLDLRTSEAPPEGGLPPSVPPLLLRGTLNPTNLTYGYTPLTVGGPVLWTLAPAGGQGSEVEGKVRMPARASPAAPVRVERSRPRGGNEFGSVGGQRRRDRGGTLPQDLRA